jgi:hypothetical protein
VAFDPASAALPRLPAIVVLTRPAIERDGRHFVVLFGTKGDAVQVLNYPRAPEFVPSERLAKGWDGRGLCVAASPENLPGGEPPLWQRWLVLTGGLAVTIVSIGLLVWRRKGRAAKCG